MSNINLNALLDTLTIEEKIGQMTMISPHFFLKDTKTEIAGPVAILGIGEKEIFETGSVLGIGDATEMIAVQKKYLEKSRHQIPLIFMADVIHGYETIFPVPLGLAASWNDELIELSARISAIEASTAGIHVTFAPMADLVRDPRWGRVVESYGEDSYLNGRFAALQVKGFQGKNIKKDGNIASCVKHFAAYGAAEAGKDYNTVDMSRLRLHQFYMSGYQKAIHAGAKMVMTSFNVFEGIPATANKYLLTDVLRKQWKFKGVTISDYASLRETITHGTSRDEYHATVNGITAGLDIEMATALYIKYVKEALEKGDITLKSIDDAVLRILKLKQACGLFDNPYKGASLQKEKQLVRHKKHLEASLKVAEESIVLLKNDQNIFPINKGKIALIGRYAQSGETNGPWSWHGSKHQNATLYDELSKVLNIHYVNDGTSIDFDQVSLCDYVIIAAGEDKNQSGEAHSRSSIKLPDHQEEMIVDIHLKTGRPIGLVLFNGRPLNLTGVIDFVDGLIEAFFPGSMGAKALANIITGKVNPSGKLTMSFPRSVGQIPVYYNYLNTGRPLIKPDQYKSYFLDLESTPLYPFGYGLSYSHFEYANLALSTNKLKGDEKLLVTVDVTNTSEVAGKEVVQLYIRDYVAQVSRPVLELIDFQKIQFLPNETKTVSFEITKDQLKYIGPKLNEVIDQGKIGVFVGGSSDKLISADFELV